MNKLMNIFKSEKGGKIIFFIGIAGIVIIFLSSFFGPDGKETVTGQPLSDEAYTQLLEEQLTKMVKSITGSRDVSVIVTLESSTEYIYADELSQSKDISQADDKTQQKENSQKSYKVIDSGTGKEEALLVTAISPKIRGVVVVAKGADNSVVISQIQNAVMTALDISSKRVFVTSTG